MHTREIARWLVGAICASGAIAVSMRNASADHRLVAAVYNTTGCAVTAGGTANVFGEAYGFEPYFNTVQCEAMSINGTTMAQCPTTATYHKAEIEARGSGYGLTGARYAVSPAQMTWTSTSAAIGYTFQCAGSINTTVYAMSVGEEVP